MTDPLRTSHQERVEAVMGARGQRVRDTPGLPTERERRLRARLIMREALGAVRELGFSVFDAKQVRLGEGSGLGLDSLFFQLLGDPELVKIVDSCADLTAVVTGTFSSCGVAARPVLELVDMDNLKRLAGVRNPDQDRLSDIAKLLGGFALLGRLSGVE